MESSLTMTSRQFSIETIGIVGTGAMGRGIAQIAALSGLTVRLFDANPEAVGAALSKAGYSFKPLRVVGSRRVLEVEPKSANQVALFIFDRKV